MNTISVSTMQSAKQKEQIDHLNDEAWSLNRTDPAEGLSKATEALALAEVANYKVGIAIAKGNMAACNLWLSNFTETLALGHASCAMLEELNEKEKLSQIQYIISVVHYFLGDIKKELEFAFRSLSVAEDANFKHGMANSLNGIGSAYYTNNENEKAIEYLNKGLAICDEIGDRHVKVRILDGLGEATHNLGQYEKALSFKMRSLMIARELGIKQVESYALDGIGAIYLALNELDEAIRHFKEAISVRQEMGFRAGEAVSTLHLGHAYIQSGKTELAESTLQSSLKIALELNAKDTLSKAYEALALIYEQKGDLQNFAQHIRKYHQVALELNNERSSQKLKSAELEAQMERINQEKQLLEEKNGHLERYMHDMQILERIGRELISTLELEDILKTVYEQVNDIMDASVFGIGLYNPSTHSIDMEFTMEKGQRLPSVSLSLEKDKDRIGIWVANNKKEAIINDVEVDMEKYVGKITRTAFIGELPNSIVYIPLLLKQKLVGILTVQSFEKYAYANYQLGLLRNVAIYASSAIENANLYKDLEETVRVRTQEVIIQKEELEFNNRSAQLLNEIGQQLISTLDIEAVFENLHNRVNNMMDAACFGIRLYDTEKQVVNYKYEIEKGSRQEEVEVSMEKKNNYSVWCIEHKESIMIGDNQAEYHKYVDEIMVVSGEMPHSLLFQPLLKGDEVLGVITVQSFEKHAYSDYHLNILKTLSAYTVIAIENARTFLKVEEKVSERTADIVRLSEIGQQIISHLSIEKINEVIYENLNQMMDAPSFGIGVYNKHNGTLSFPGYIEEGKLLAGSSFTLYEKDRMAVACFNNELEILIGDYDKEHMRYVKQNHAPKAGKSVTSLMYLPLKIKDEKVGVITIQSFKKQAYTQYHFNILKNLGAYAAIAIENARLYEGLEEMVEERTTEVVRQKEEIEKNHRNTELLSQIGKQITSSLSIPDIVSSVYENINKIMDAACFGVGVYDPANHAILMPGLYENGEHIEDFQYHCDDSNRLAVQCFTSQKEIIINDYGNEYVKYIKGIQKPVSGKDASSIIYIPVYSKDKAIGVITVQSFAPNSYNEFHVNLVRNLSVYVGIALENATLYLNLEEKVRERTQEVIEQKEIIEEKNKSITDSIKYAKRIQDATLPDEGIVSEFFQDSFILFKPKDIVSGDFYWFEKHMDTNGKRKVLFAVVDCTGHGVPGAFMSIIGHNALNQIVKEYGITTPSLILDKLNLIINNSLITKAGHDDIQVKDGMDIALCCFHVDDQILEFAGALNPLYLIRNHEIIEYKGDKLAIGAGIETREQNRYHNHLINLQHNDRIFIFSDGYADQFGGAYGKKFKYNRFKEYLLEIQTKPMIEQRHSLNRMIEEWRGEIEQIDDVCIMGVCIA